MSLGAETNSLLSGIIDAVRSQTRTLDEHFNEIDDRRSERKAPFSNKTVGEINRERKAAENSANAMADNAKRVNEASEKFKAFSLNSANAADKVNEMAREFRDSGVVMSDTLKNQVDALINSTSMGDLQVDQYNDLVDELEHYSKAMDNATTNTIKQAKETHKYTKGMIVARKHIEDFAKEAGSLKGVIAGLGASAVLSADHINEATRRQVPLMDLTAMELSSMSAQYGISAREMMSVTDDYTATILANAKDGASVRQAAVGYLDTFSNLRDQARDLTGSYEEANRLVAATFSSMSRLGIDTTFEEIQDPASQLMKSMQTLARITGRSAEEEAKMLEAMMNEREMRLSVLQVGEGDRINFLNKLAQDKLLFKAKGMEIEQAEQAAKSLRRLTTEQDPREIYANAAKIAQVAGAIGVEGGQEFMREMMKPAEQRNTEILRDFSSRFEAAQQERLGQGAGSGTAMSTFAMTSAVQGPVMDLMREISTAGMEGQAVSEETMEGIVKQTSVLTGIQDEIKTGSEIWQRIEPWIREPAFAGTIGVSMGAANALLGVIAKNTGVMAATGGGGGITGKLGKIVGGTAIAGVAAFAVKDAIDAFTTGESASHDFIKGTVIEDSIHGMFAGVEKLSSFFSGEGWTTELERAQEQMAKLQEETNQRLKDLADAQKENTGAVIEGVEATKGVTKATEKVGQETAQATRDSTKKAETLVKHNNRGNLAGQK